MIKKRLFFVVFLILIIGGLIWFKRDNFKHIKRDWNIGIVTSEGIGLVTVSPARRMVNTMKINEKVQVWIPGGTGWIESNRVQDILKKSDDKKMANKVFFYNFGFVPDKIEYLDKFDDWSETGRLLKTIGFLPWVNFSYIRDRVIFNNETIDKDLSEENSFLDEVMMRDFADTQLTEEEDVKITVINTTQENGLASFLSNRLEWAGASVISATNDSKEIKQNCLMSANLMGQKTMAANLIDELFGCEKSEDKNLPDGEIELYFGENFTKVIKYSSYVRTF